MVEGTPRYTYGTPLHIAARSGRGQIRSGMMSDMANAEWMVTSALGVDPATVGAAVADKLREIIGLFDHDLRLVGANRSLRDALGYATDDLLGMSALELIAPDHHERALLILGMASGQGTMDGAAPFDLIKADGSFLTVQVTGADVRLGDHPLLAVIGRQGDETTAIGLVLDRLLAHEELHQVLEPLLDLFAWRLTGAAVAITWSIDGIRESVSTGLPDPLSGMGILDPDGPWSRALRTGRTVLGSVDELLDATGRDLARQLGFGQVWVEPVATTSDTPDATITVFTAEDSYSPLVHRYGADETRRYLEVVLRWSDGFRRLEEAARTDDLTGLANRRAFFTALAASTGGGAILFADLDGFKAVNDRWGHAVGDTVLTEVGRRLTASVDPDVCVARVGGDEFAVILCDVTAESAAATAERIRGACAEPFDVDGGTLTLGISVGIAHDLTDLGAAVLHAADRDQYTEKRRRTTGP